MSGGMTCARWMRSARLKAWWTAAAPTNAAATSTPCARRSSQGASAAQIATEHVKIDAAQHACVHVRPHPREILHGVGVDFGVCAGLAAPLARHLSVDDDSVDARRHRLLRELPIRREQEKLEALRSHGAIRGGAGSWTPPVSAGPTGAANLPESLRAPRAT